MVYSTSLGCGPICMVPVKCTLEVLWFSSLQEDSTVPLPFMFPLQTQSAVMPWSLIFVFSALHSLLRDGGMGLPYLSIISWVTQTWEVCGPPMAADILGMFSGN